MLTVDPAVLRFDEATFQPRTQTLDWHVDRMAREWDDARAGTVDVIELEPGQYTVVSGHHRTRAALRRNEMIERGEIEGEPVEIDIRIHRGDTPEEAIREGVRLGMLGNEGAVGQSPVDGARAIAQLRRAGFDDADIARQLGHGTRVDIVTRRGKLNELPEDLRAAITDNWDFRKSQVKNAHGMTESKGYDMTRLRDSGAVDNATLQQMYYDDVVATDTPLTDAEFTAYIDRKLTIAQEFGVSRATLFDMNDYANPGNVTIRDIEKQIAKQDAALDRERSAIERLDRRSGDRFDDATRRDHQKVVREIEAERERLLQSLRDQFRKNNPSHRADIAALEESAPEVRTVPANGGDQVMMDFTTPREATPPRGQGMLGGVVNSAGEGEMPRFNPQPPRPDEPALASGMVRLYRGQDMPSARKPVSEWMQTQPRFQASQAASGRWFTEDRNIAEWYVTTDGNPDTGGQIMYVDIPADQVGQFRVRGSDVESFSRDADNELFVSPEIAAQRQPLNNKVYFPDGRVETTPEVAPTPARDVAAREASPTQAKKRVAQKRQRAQHGEVTPAPGVDPETITPIPRRPRHDAKDPTGLVDVESGTPEWADADVPEMSLEARRILEDGGREPDGRIPKPDGPETPNETIYGMLVPPPVYRWVRGGVHKVQRKVHAANGVPSRTHLVTTNDGARYWLRRPITEQEISALTAHEFADGETFMDRVSRRVEEYGQKDNWRRVNEVAENTETLNPYEARAIADTYAEMEARLLELYPDYALVKKVTGSRPYRALPSPVRKTLEGIAWALRGFLGMVDRYAQMARDRMLHSHFRAVSYPGTQLLGNTTNAVIGGRLDIAARQWTPDNMRSAFRLSRQQAKDMPKPWEHDISISANQRMHARLGTREGREVRQTWQGNLGNMNDPLMGTKWMQKWGPTKAASKLLGSKAHARNAAAFDIVFRDVSSQRIFMQRMKNDVLPDYRNQTIGRLVDDWGFDRADATALWREFTDSLDHWEFDLDDVVDFFGPRIGEGRATRLGRDWQQAIYKVEKDVRSEVQRLTFAGDETRADVVLKRLFLFHHFMTRQSYFYASQLLHHPFLINVYFNMVEELEKATEDWPPYLNGWVKLFATPFGYQLFLNPTALAATFITFNDRAFTFPNEGETEAGSLLKRVSNTIGLHPLLAVGANMAGIFGDDFAPDPLFLWREANAVTLAINWGRANGWLGDDITPRGNWYEQTNLDLRETISGWNPWRDDAVEATSSEENMDRQVQMLVVDEAMRDGLDPENPEDMAVIQEAMFDPESVYYQRAVKRWVNGEAVEIAMQFVAGMFRPRQRPINEGAVEGGFADAPSDLYHSFDRSIKTVINTASPEVAEMRTQQAAFYDLGTDEQRQAADIWNQIAYGPMHHPITVGGTEYSVREIHEMSPDQRRQLADAALQEHGLLDDVQELRDERDRFLAQPENARMAQQRQWADAVRDYPGGIDAYWQEAIKNNENARAYYDDVMSRDYVLDEQREQALTNQYAYFAIGGIQMSVWDPVPEMTSRRGGIYDPVGIVGTAPQPTPYEEPNAEYATAIREGLPETMVEMEEWDGHIKRVQRQMGVDPSIPFNELDYDTRRAIEDELEGQGIREPEVPWQVKNYLEWAEQQPQGADTSVDAYLRANQAEYREGATERLEESLAMPEAQQGPDRYGNQPPPPEDGEDVWLRILDLMNIHDHNRYPDTNSTSSSGSGNYWLFDHLP